MEEIILRCEDNALKTTTKRAYEKTLMSWLKPMLVKAQRAVKAVKTTARPCHGWTLQAAMAGDARTAQKAISPKTPDATASVRNAL